MSIISAFNHHHTCDYSAITKETSPAADHYPIFGRQGHFPGDGNRQGRNKHTPSVPCSQTSTQAETRPALEATPAPDGVETSARKHSQQRRIVGRACWRPRRMKRRPGARYPRFARGTCLLMSVTDRRLRHPPRWVALSAYVTQRPTPNAQRYLRHPPRWVT
jgi:hypothetical protein